MDTLKLLIDQRELPADTQPLVLGFIQAEPGKGRAKELLDRCGIEISSNAAKLITGDKVLTPIACGAESHDLPAIVWLRSNVSFGRATLKLSAIGSSEQPDELPQVSKRIGDQPFGIKLPRLNREVLYRLRINAHQDDGCVSDDTCELGCTFSSDFFIIGGVAGSEVEGDGRY